MSVCGYNRVMEAGMAAFAQGIAIQADKRATREKKSIPEVVVAELEELDTFVRLLSASPKSQEMTTTIGFAVLVRGLFAEVQAVLEKRPFLPAANAFERVTKPFNRLMFELEEHYFDQPAAAGVEAKMTALTKLAESRV